MNLSINGVTVPVQGVRALKPGITIEQASQRTKNNGLDEIYFTSGGKSYVAYGDSLDISSLKKNQIPTVMINGLSADVIAYEDEANSAWEGARRGAVNAFKDTSDAISGAVRNIVTTIGPTASLAGGIGVAGLGIWQVWKSTQGGTVALSAASGGFTGGLPGLGQGIADALKSGVVGGLKLIAVAGAVGAGITLAYGAMKGALDAKNGNKDLTSIASVTEDGTTPVNGGPAQANYPGFTPNPLGTNPGVTTPSTGLGVSPPMSINPGGITIQINGGGFQSMPAQPSNQLNSVGGLMSPHQLSSQSRR
jgi:hypothetical protein